MKTKLLFPLVCMAMLLTFAGCSDDDESLSYQYGKLNDLKFQLSEVAATSTTFTFDVEVSDAEVDYLCLYVDKAVIDQVEKAELPAYLMDDLRKQADAKGEPFEAYLSSISYKGNLSGKKIENLLPGRLYELVVFGIQGTKAAQRAEYLFFQTLTADPVECTFEVAVEPQGRTAKYTVKPSVKDIPYHFGTFPKSTYDQLVAQNWDDEAILMEYFQSQYQQVLGSLMQPGQQQPTQEQIMAALEMLLFQGDVQLEAKGLSANTEYVWLAGAFKLVDVEGALQLVLVSDAAQGEYTTLPLDLMRDFTFDIEVSDIAAGSAHITVTPSLTTEKFIWTHKPHTPETENMSAEELMDKYIKENSMFLGWLSTSGVQDVDVNLIPNRKYYVLSFGYDGGVTSHPALEQFQSLPGGDPSAVTFTARLIQNTPYRMAAEVVPSDNSVPYIVKFFPTTPDFNLTVAKETLEAEVAQNYKMQSMFNPGMAFDDFLYRFYNIGTKSFENYEAVAGQAFTLCAFALDMEGKVAATLVEEAFATTPELSDVTLKGEVMGYFDGDEEAGAIFGDATLTQGRCIIAMKYTRSAGVVAGQAGLVQDDATFDELDPNVISDKDLMSQVNWSEVPQNGYFFVMGDWGVALNSFSYGIDENNCEGAISRMAVAAPDASQVNPIEELRDMVANTRAARFMPLASAAPWPKKEAPEAAAENKIPMPWKPAAKPTVKAPALVLGADLYLPVAHPVR